MFDKHFFRSELRPHLFEKGDFKYVILDLLKDKPRHGYEIIRALEERFEGLYSPSAGTVYPTLQLLDDMGYVVVSEQDNKKIHTFTEDGRRFLKEREERMDKIRDHIKDWQELAGEKRHEIHEMAQELRRLCRLLAHQAAQLEPEKLSRIKEIIFRASHDVEAILFD